MTAPANTAELKRLAEAAIRMASDGWKMMPDVPTEAMTEALERSESYCDSCHGTAFSGWSGYEALFKAAPSEAITPSVVLSLISTIERQAEEIPAWRSMDDAPKDCIIIAMCRYPSATAGSPSFVSWDGEFGWEYSRNKPEKMVCWAWMPREILGDWPSEALSHSKTKEGT